MVIRGFINRLLLVFDWVDISLPISDFVCRLRKTKGVAIKSLIANIVHHLSLKKLSRVEKTVALLSMSKKITAVAAITGLSDKGAYNVLSTVVKKMNAHSSNHLRYFLMREYGAFSLAELTAI